MKTFSKAQKIQIIELAKEYFEICWKTFDGSFFNKYEHSPFLCDNVNTAVDTIYEEELMDSRSKPIVNEKCDALLDEMKELADDEFDRNQMRMGWWDTKDKETRLKFLDRWLEKVREEK